MPTVARLSITPVKSTALHHPREVHLDTYGVAENRRFFMVDSDGKLLNGSIHPQFVQIKADFEPDREHLSLHFPDGTIAEGSAVAVGEEITVDFWGRPTVGHVLDGTWTLPLSAFAGERVRLVRAEHYGGGTDVRPLTLVSTASVEEFSGHAGRDDADARRFRMLMELDGMEPHEEDTWADRSVRIGGAVVKIGRPVPRCIVVQQDPDTGEKDLQSLKVIYGYRGRSADNTLDFGVYGDVEEPGLVRVGDPVEPL
jgi:uncharacterized protein